MKRIWGIVLFGALATCKPPTFEPGGLVVVTLDTGLHSTCVRVQIKPASGNAVKSEAIAIGGKTSIAVGIVKKDFPDSVDVMAIGYSDLDCTTLTVPAELSDSATLTFATPPPTVSVKLANAAVAVDNDMDGVAVPTDCNDADAQVSPALPENCSDHKDNNCDAANAIDCADSTCESRACVTGVAVGLAACASGKCAEKNCSNQLDDNFDGNTDCGDPTCNAAPCGVGGTCSNGGCHGETQESLCGDGVDNDSDGKTDCADGDCSAKACNDSKACTTGETCSGTICTGGVVSCQSTTACYSTPGTCGPGGACQYLPKALGATCEDGLKCTISDACNGDGGCASSPVTCPPAAQCRQAGVCSEAADGGCVYDVLSGGSCQDNDPCTTTDTCLANGSCAGTAVTCAAVECFAVTACGADGGCQSSSPTPGAACAGGRCGPTGQCVPFVIPSNVTLQDAVQPDAGAFTLGTNCVLRIDTGDDGARAPSLLTDSCNAGMPPYAIVTPDGGPALMLIAASVVSLETGSTLHVVGSRPFALASAGDITINGSVLAGPWSPPDGGARDGAGGNLSAFCRDGIERGQSPGTTVSAGAGGGAYGSAGKSGGRGLLVGMTSTPGGDGGIISGSANLIPLRGGCEGGRGGNPGPIEIAQNLGRAGGALQFIAQGAFTLRGLVAAPGGGGNGSSPSDRGGGGGGSGGAILVEARTVFVNGALTANGGSGGSGSRGTGGNPGNQGNVNSIVPAAGATGPTSYGGFGGDGAAGTTEATAGTDFRGGMGNGGGGGGGGGGVGRIRVNALGGCDFNLALFSPAASVNCH